MEVKKKVVMKALLLDRITDLAKNKTPLRLADIPIIPGVRGISVGRGQYRIAGIESG